MLSHKQEKTKFERNEANLLFKLSFACFGWIHHRLLHNIS